MSAMHDRDNTVTPLFGNMESVRLEFQPSEFLRERIEDLVRPSKQEEIGRRGLFLYSEHGEEVHRRNGVLTGDDAKMESDMYKVVSAQSVSQQKLARYVAGELIQRPQGMSPLFVLRLGIALDLNTVASLQNAPNIRPGYLTGRTVPVRIAFSADLLLPTSERHGPVQRLQQAIYGTHSPNFQGTSDERGMYVSDMKFVFQKVSSKSQ